MAEFPLSFGNTNTKKEIFKDILWDTENNVPVFEGGEPVIVSGLKALSGWVCRAVQTERYRYKIHTRAYGCEIKSLTGKPFTNAVKEIEIKRYISECLLTNPYITDVSDFQVYMKEDVVYISGTVNTVYGKLEVLNNV